MRLNVVLCASLIGLTGFAPLTSAEPATQPADQVEALRREIADLRAENQRLHDELADQKHETAAAKSAAAMRPAAPVKKNWKDELSVGMTEADVEALFTRLPRERGSLPTARTVASSTGNEKIVQWFREPVDHAAGNVGSHASLTQAPVTHAQRLCTITIKDGIVTAVEF